MAWLDPSDDEVECFHPAFEGAANDALIQLGLDGTHHWVHHPPSASDRTIPDFVLVENETQRWVLIVEIKRTRSAVFSGRFQAQAKSYADGNQARFRPGWPVYFATTNLEATVFCALNGMRPVSECVFVGGTIDSGSFDSQRASEHRRRFIHDLVGLIGIAYETKVAEFEVVWPPIVDTWLQHADSFAQQMPDGPPEPTSKSWSTVAGYFGQPPNQSAARATMLQGLLAVFMKGRLMANNHPRANTVPAVNTRQQIGRAIGALRAIDFDAIFDEGASQRYSRPKPSDLSPLEAFVEALSSIGPKGIGELAEIRQDYVELIEQVLLSIYPLEQQAASGKVQTDPELASVLAALAIEKPGTVIDPCCGDGPLLIAGHDRLVDLGHTYANALDSVKGVEADPVASRLAAARLALRATAVLGPEAQPQVSHGDMFTASAELGEADVVLMNPPFRRYEDQGENPIPMALIEHYTDAIRGNQNHPPDTLDGQPNLFHYYVEFVARHIQPGAVIGLVLDNKWFNNKTGASLRSLFLSKFQLVALVEYPHRAFFAAWDIATSLLVAVRDDEPPNDHFVQFVRSRDDPRGVDLRKLAKALHKDGSWPSGWKAEAVPQACLKAKDGWKRHFAGTLAVDLSSMGLLRLSSLFARSRRGSLEKEGGGTHVFAFPFSRNKFGQRRDVGNGRPFHTNALQALSAAENESLRDVAAAIPKEFRGKALKRADKVGSYELGSSDVEVDETLEPPNLRKHPELFMGATRSKWTPEHETAIEEIENDQHAGEFLRAVEKYTNLTSAVLPNSERFVDLREPFAGELIIPRKTRTGHRVHINPFAFDPNQRQVRISTNFVTYANCLAVDEDLDRPSATRLIAAFLISSFGQLQFEEIGNNREGLLSNEKAGLDELLVLDPREIAASRRNLILEELTRLPYPVPAEVTAASQARVTIDRRFAEELAPRCQLSADELLLVVHDGVDEWIGSREP